MSRHTSHHDRPRLVAEWRASDQSAASFSRQRGVASSTFANWIKRYPLAPASTVAPAPFIAVLPETEAPSRDAFVVTVGSQPLTFDAPPPPEWFAAVLRGLATC